MGGLAIERQLRRIKLQWIRMCEHILYVLIKQKEDDLLLLTCIMKCMETVFAISKQIKSMKRGNMKVCQANWKKLGCQVEKFKELTEEMDNIMYRLDYTKREIVRQSNTSTQRVFRGMVNTLKSILNTFPNNKILRKKRFKRTVNLCQGQDFTGFF